MLTYNKDSITTPYDEVDYCLHLSSTADNDTYRLNNMPTIPGDYTFSVWGKSIEENIIDINILGVAEIFTLSSSWSKIEITVTSDGTCSYIDIILPANIEIWLYEGQLEDGAVATSWHLAPEDINESIEKAKQHADELFSGINTHDTEISQLKDTVLTWTNGALGQNTYIYGGWIHTNTITAEKIALSDFTNYVTVNESNEATTITSNHPFVDGNTIISDGYISKSVETSVYLALSNYCANSFEDNNELYYSFTIKGSSTGTCKLGIWFYGDGTADDKTYKTAYLSSAHSFTTSETTFSGTIKIDTCKTYGYYAIGIKDESSTKNQIYIKDISVRKKNGGELIVDGSITADKIDVNTLSAITANIGQLTIDGYLTTNSDRTAYNQEISGLTIDANGIGGWGGSTQYFTLTKNGVITATSGTIGGWTITTTSLYSSKEGGSIYLLTKDDSSNYWMRVHDAASGGGNRTFSISKTGAVVATSADIKGKITATSGAIGDWTIGTALYNSNGGSTLAATTAGTAYIGTDGLNFYQSSSAYFKVQTDTGKLICAGAEIIGDITANGQINIINNTYTTSIKYLIDTALTYYTGYEYSKGDTFDDKATTDSIYDVLQIESNVKSLSLDSIIIEDFVSAEVINGNSLSGNKGQFRQLSGWSLYGYTLSLDGTAYFGDRVYMGYGTQYEKNLTFENSNANSTYQHDISIYGASGDSTRALGIWDAKNSKNVWYYDDVSMQTTFISPLIMEERLIPKKGSYIHTARGTSGSTGYVKVAQINITSNYRNASIILHTLQRGISETILSIRFVNVDSSDPGVESFTYEGKYPAYLVKSATGAWDLYLRKTESYDYICISEYYNSPYNTGGMTITWTDVHADALPDGYITSTIYSPGDSGWITINSFQNSFTQASTSWESTCKYRKIGNHVYVKGGVASPSSWTGSTATIVLQLPSGYRPLTRKYVLNALSGIRVARILVDTTGEIYIEWTRNLTDGSVASGSLAYIAIDIDFLID